MILTVGRIILAPVFFVLYSTAGNGSPLIFFVWAAFILIEASDILDGLSARALKLETEIGKVLDPFADSISRITYFICFAWSGFLPIWILLILVYRDVTVSYLRVIASKKGVMLGARLSGKLKAWVYGLSGTAGIVVFTLYKMGWAESWLPIAEKTAFAFFLAAGAMALWSLADYAMSLRIIFGKSVDK
jgi:CDP-diacylglycerol--glycerol-3-phosphate 3-phosphatidyltransferase